MIFNIDFKKVINYDMNPVSWTWKRGFYMSKLSYEEKIEIYNKRKAGVTLNTLHSKYGITKHNIQYLVWLIDRHGFDILKHTKNKYYPPYQKEQIINRVLLNNESIQSVSVDEGLPSEGMLHTWIKNIKKWIII